MSGPLPNPNRRRRNAPTIPTTDLPASGRRGSVPKVPDGYDLAAAGSAWWRWAWKTPQAAGWSAGDLYVVARRALLEDDLAALKDIDAEVFRVDDMVDATDEALKSLIGRLKALAVGELQVAKEARELDDRLGLTPKGLAALRWRIVDDQEETPAARASSSGRRRDLKVV